MVAVVLVVVLSVVLLAVSVAVKLLGCQPFSDLV